MAEHRIKCKLCGELHEGRICTRFEGTSKSVKRRIAATLGVPTVGTLEKKMAEENKEAIKSEVGSERDWLAEIEAAKASLEALKAAAAEAGFDLRKAAKAEHMRKRRGK